MFFHNEERKSMKCKECNHLYYSNEVHTCPDAEYLNCRDKLISAAASYDEDNWFNEDGKHIEQ